MSHAITELDEVLFYEKEQEALKKVLEEAEYAAKMEERSLEIQRNFLEKEKIKRAKDIEEWYQVSTVMGENLPICLAQVTTEDSNGGNPSHLSDSG